MEDAAYNEAADPQPFRAFGLELKPLSIGHFLLLQRQGSVFLKSDVGPMPIAELVGEATTAVLICSQPCEEFNKTLRSRFLPWFVKYWRWKTRKLDTESELQALYKYFEAQTNLPEVLRSVNRKADAPKGGMPWISILHVFLMADLHMSPTEALNCPLLLAQWHFYAFLALRGNDQTIGRGLDEAIRIAKGELN